MIPKYKYNESCLKCTNYLTGFKCVAFPYGIPNEILTGENKHIKHLKNQGNSIVFDPIN